MQQKLESFFKISSNTHTKNKKCFIYDPQNYSAFFDTKPSDSDTFIISKSGIKLYYRNVVQKDINFPLIKDEYSIPLLKSNLQKAIRRCDNQIAIQTSLAILQKNPLELLRRLPIIYIEDVCLMDSYPIIIWRMIADKDYKLSSFDFVIILNIVDSLCNCKEYFDFNKNETEYNFSHESLQDYENHNELLAIYYRSEYGGMKCDIQMLKSAIDYYINNPLKIPKTVYNKINYDIIGPHIEILVEAIDFHPFPQMLNTLSKITQIDKNIIKEFIWFVESGYNVRKYDTIYNSKIYEERIEWIKIEKHLENLRIFLIY